MQDGLSVALDGSQRDLIKVVIDGKYVYPLRDMWPPGPTLLPKHDAAHGFHLALNAIRPTPAATEVTTVEDMLQQTLHPQARGGLQSCLHVLGRRPLDNLGWVPRDSRSLFTSAALMMWMAKHHHRCLWFQPSSDEDCMEVDKEHLWDCTQESWSLPLKAHKSEQKVWTDDIQMAVCSMMTKTALELPLGVSHEFGLPRLP